MKKLSISLSGHQTSITLEPEFFTALTTLAAQMGKSVAGIINEIDATRTGNMNLSSAVRVWILNQMTFREIKQ
ncbi:MAG: ribbon-helix-helix domain-containing protein [Alphaproteobacteria bacterium]|nr:ribbon-helix-helix domain-containing protein [Alphaproteobacteria bacterium]